jgi:hypothetical protein
MSFEQLSYVAQIVARQRKFEEESMKEEIEAAIDDGP